MADNTVIGGGNPATGAGNTAVPGGTGTGAAQASNLGELRRRLSLIAQQQGNAGAQAGGTGTVIPPAQAALAAAAAAGGAGNAAGATLTAIEIQARIAQYDIMFGDSLFYGPIVADTIKKLSGLTPVSGIMYIKDGICEMPVFDNTTRPTGP